MKIIFDCETEVGKCDCERDLDGHLNYAEPTVATIIAHTQAALNTRGILRIEQHCFLRNGEDVPEQPWVRPRISLEAGLAGEEEMRIVAQTMHERYLVHARAQVPDDVLV